MDEAKASTADTTIVPPTDTLQIELTMVEVGGDVELRWNGQIGDELDLKYTPPGFLDNKTCLITIDMLEGWTIDRGSISDPLFIFSHPSPLVWQIQVPWCVIFLAACGQRQIEEFNFRHVSGRRHDPRIVVEREG